MGVPEWETPNHLNAVKSATNELNRCAGYAESLLRPMKGLPNIDVENLRDAGTVTIEQISHLHAVLSGDANSLDTWRKQRNRAGGRNPGAYIVSEGIRRLFRKQRKPITFGQLPEGGPSTEFCRCVAQSLGDFGILSDWRGPARAAFDKQTAISGRLNRCKLQKITREAESRSAPDVTDISITFETEEGEKFVLFSLISRSDIPALKLNHSWFKSGIEIKEKAREWADSFEKPTR